ncbi:MAG: phosphatase PAP2 family protein [Ginsengibacter sp.]
MIFFPDQQMTFHKNFANFFLLLVFSLYAAVSFAQDSLQRPGSVKAAMIADSVHEIGSKPQNNYLKPKAIIVPATFLIYGGLKPVIKAIPELDDKIMRNVETNHATFHTNAADYLMWAPSAAIYTLDAFNVKTQHTFKQHLILDAGSIVITGAFGFGMRKITENIRAFNQEGSKFPSGHTANAFRGAEILHQELKYSHPILSYSGYVVSTGVGMLRIYNKQHYLSEVIAGAGLGILSTKLTYWIFDKIKR